MDFDKLYHQRQTYGQQGEERGEAYGNGQLVWDYTGYDQQYFNFSNLNNLD